MAEYINQAELVKWVSLNLLLLPSLLWVIFSIPRERPILILLPKQPSAYVTLIRLWFKPILIAILGDCCRGTVISAVSGVICSLVGRHGLDAHPRLPSQK